MPAYIKCSSGTGRFDVEITYTSFFFVRPTQSANSASAASSCHAPLVFGTVADNSTMLMCEGSRIMTSSHTTPRCVSRAFPIHTSMSFT